MSDHASDHPIDTQIDRTSGVAAKTVRKVRGELGREGPVAAIPCSTPTATAITGWWPDRGGENVIRVGQIARGVPVTTLAAQLGHTRKSVTLDVYSHVLLDE